jgi:hypothetical protein
MGPDCAEVGRQRIESCGEGLAFPWDGVFEAVAGKLGDDGGADGGTAECGADRE